MPYDPVIPLLSMYLEKTIILKDTCTPFFIAALFTIAKTWKQATCPSTDNWFTKIIHNEYYSAIKKNELLLSSATWVDAENTTLREVNQTEKDKYYMISLIYGI